MAGPGFGFPGRKQLCRIFNFIFFQAAQRIVNEEPHNAIAMLKELSQNFPLHAQWELFRKLKYFLKFQVFVPRKCNEADARWDRDQSEGCPVGERHA